MVLWIAKNNRIGGLKEQIDRMELPTSDKKATARYRFDVIVVCAWPRRESRSVLASMVLDPM